MTDSIETAAGAAASQGAAGPLRSLAETLGAAGVDILAVGRQLAGNASLQTVSAPLQFVGQALVDAGRGIAAAGSGIAPQTQLGASADDGDGSSPEQRLAAYEEHLAARKKLLDEFHQHAVGLDQKLTFESIKNMGLQVAETIVGTKKMAKVRKAMAIADVIRGRAEAVMTAAKSAPFPANLPAIAFAVATGQAQQAIVNQAHSGLDKIPKTGTYLLERGERVIGRRLNEDLRSFLGDANLGRTFAANIDRSISNSSSFTPTINMSFAASAGEDAISANRGAIESMIRQIYADYALEAPFGN